MKKLTAKIYFDIIMALLWLFMLFFDEDFWHELLGLFIALLALIHLAYNLRKMKTEIPAIFMKKRLSLLGRYLTNGLLFVSAACTIVIGLFISKDVFPSLYVYNRQFWEEVHELPAYLTIASILLHIFFHRKMITAVLTKKS